MSKTGKTGSPFASGNRDAVRRHPPFVRTGLTFAALGLFVTAAALAVVKPSSHDELPELYQASQALALPDLAVEGRLGVVLELVHVDRPVAQIGRETWRDRGWQEV